MKTKFPKLMIAPISNQVKSGRRIKSRVVQGTSAIPLFDKLPIRYQTRSASSSPSYSTSHQRSFAKYRNTKSDDVNVLKLARFARPRVAPPKLKRPMAPADRQAALGKFGGLDRLVELFNRGHAHGEVRPQRYEPSVTSRPKATAEPPPAREGAQAGYDVFRTQVRSYEQLPTGWDTYSAEPIGKLAIHLALRFVDLVQKHGLNIEWTAPTVDDSVMVVLTTPSGKQEWDFYGNGETAVMFQKPDGEKRYVDLAEPEFESFLSQLWHG